jgi:2-hydroxy-6-oxonona-2,4-dienedioate hydrolase
MRRLIGTEVPAGDLSLFTRISPDPVPDGRVPIVMVHGLVVSGRFLNPAMAVLGRDFRVYAPDLPGFGRSPKPPHTLDVPQLAAALDAWMDGAGIAQATLVGISFGCNVATELAAGRPERAERVVLLGPTMDRKARSFPRAAWRWTLETPFELTMAPILARDYYRAGLQRTLGTIRAMLEHRIEECMPQLTMPVLVMRGSLDPIAPQRWVDELTALLPNGRQETIDGHAHALNFTEPQLFGAAVHRFIAETTQPPHLPDEAGTSLAPRFLANFEGGER